MNNNKRNLLLVGGAAAVMGSLLTLLILMFAIRMTGINPTDIMRFFGVMKFIESRYVESTDTGKLIDGAIAGMVESLHDPHSVYLTPEFYKELREYTNRSFGGIGVTMGFKDNKVTIISVLDDTPGKKAGLQAGDNILTVDGVPVAEMISEEIVMKIRGEAGTPVKLSILRDSKELDFNIVREMINVPSLVANIIDSTNIGYIRIASFSENTGAEFAKALTGLENNGIKALVLDLRQNPGGLITSCVEVAQKLVPKGIIVSVEERDGSREVYESKLAENKYPIVVLIDEHSASASEIIAGALQDTGAAEIIGTTSYGKGSVQMVMPLLHADGLKLTVAKYYTPNGRSIDGVGIKPDIEVEWDNNSGVDNQLEVAKKYLLDVLAKK